ncbi:MAG: ABC transporter substrate-binding protein [Thermodesulfobacteriota bacterium]
MKKRPYSPYIVAVVLVIVVSACTPNNPYRASEKGEEIFYTTFDEPPKHLDPARSYFSSEYDFLAQIYEPLVQYHYLRRPYELVPLSGEAVPVPAYFDKSGNRLPQEVSPEKVHRATYEIKVKKGVMYQPHPAFAKTSDGNLLYAKLTEADLAGITQIKHFSETGTRELSSDDFIYEIMRMADPQLHCPILPILTDYILGLDEYAVALTKELEETRAARKEKAGAAYSQTLDERANPIILDYKKYPLPGIERIDDHTFKIILKRKYPQFAYWLAMPFFSPVPEEAVRFYKQGPLADRNISIDRYPVGTGAYMMETFNENMELVLARNPNFRGEPYPADGEEGDGEKGLLEDAGRAMPFIERIVFKLEKEAIPRWNKFLQGYYDNSGISSDSFDQAVNMSAEGRAEITEFIKEKDIKLITSVRPTTYYMGFNMLDDTVGGYTPERKKLRRAISIALDWEEFIEIFSNGRGIAAMSPLPPGIFGHLKGKEGMNPYLYDWDEERQRPTKKSIDEAKKLLAEAGYPGGRDREGRPLVINFDNAWTGAESKPTIHWIVKRLRLLGIQLENRTTDYNRFQEKMQKGNLQIYFLGWNADYPDPENFFFLLHGPSGKVKHHGENSSNYASPRFDSLFKKMENMDNSPERLRIVREMVLLLQEDSPWMWGYHPVAFSLSHSWMGNLKSNSMANNTIKYRKLDTGLREERRHKWNRPNFIPIAVTAMVLVAGSVPAIVSIRRRLGLGKKGK